MFNKLLPCNIEERERGSSKQRCDHTLSGVEYSREKTVRSIVNVLILVRLNSKAKEKQTQNTGSGFFIVVAWSWTLTKLGATRFVVSSHPLIHRHLQVCSKTQCSITLWVKIKYSIYIGLPIKAESRTIERIRLNEAIFRYN